MVRTHQGWEFKLGIYQVLLLLLVVLAALLCSFYLGLFSGRNVGYEDALAANTAQLARVPISVDKEIEEEDEKAVTEVYSKLKEASPKTGERKVAPAKERNLAAIKTTDVAPLLDELIPLPQSETVVASNGIVDKTKTNLSVSERVVENVGIEDTKLAQVKDPNDSNDKTEGLIFDTLHGDEGGLKLGALVEQRGKSGEENPKTLEIRNDVGEVPSSTLKPLPFEKESAGVGSQQVTGRISVDSGFVRQDGPSKETKPEAVKVEKKEVASLPPEKTESGIVKSVLPRGWFAQLAAPKEIEDAEDLAKELRSSGFAVVVEKTVVRGERYYRVLCGPEEKREHAEILIEQLKRESYVKTEPFLRRVN